MVLFFSCVDSRKYSKNGFCSDVRWRTTTWNISLSRFWEGLVVNLPKPSKACVRFPRTTRHHIQSLTIANSLITAEDSTINAVIISRETWKTLYRINRSHVDNCWNALDARRSVACHSNVLYLQCVSIAHCRSKNTFFLFKFLYVCTFYLV